LNEDNSNYYSDNKTSLSIDTYLTSLLPLYRNSKCAKTAI